MKKIFILIIIIVIGILGFVFFQGQSIKAPQSHVLTAEGNYSCLPHADTSGPQTLECMFGLIGNDDLNYGLDMGDVTPPQDIETIGQIRVTGVFTPRAQLADSNPMLKYNIIGSIKVSEIDTVDDVDTSTTQTVAGGALSFMVPGDFRLATTPEQVLVKSYIPPCSEGFEYCLYYNGSDYKGTNFESAGVSIVNRSDLAAENSCLTTAPENYTDLTPTTQTTDTYSTSVFSPVGDAGAGHYATGSVYRLFVDTSCFELETRIGQTQFENYPAGSIEKFTDADEQAVEGKLKQVLSNVRLTSTPNTVIF